MQRLTLGVCCFRYAPQQTLKPLDKKHMKIDKNKKTFIPRNKPKSWIIGILAGLFGLLVAGPSLFVGYFFRWQLLQYLGKALFVGCWVTFALMWLLFMTRSLRGKYKKMSEKEWQNQVW